MILFEISCSASSLNRLIKLQCWKMLSSTLSRYSCKYRHVLKKKNKVVLLFLGNRSQASMDFGSLLRLQQIHLRGRVIIILISTNP